MFAYIFFYVGKETMFRHNLPFLFPNPRFLMSLRTKINKHSLFPYQEWAWDEVLKRESRCREKKGSWQNWRSSEHSGELLSIAQPKERAETTMGKKKKRMRRKKLRKRHLSHSDPHHGVTKVQLRRSWPLPSLQSTVPCFMQKAKYRNIISLLYSANRRRLVPSD